MCGGDSYAYCHFSDVAATRFVLLTARKHVQGYVTPGNAKFRKFIEPGQTIFSGENSASPLPPPTPPLPLPPPNI